MSTVDLDEIRKRVAMHYFWVPRARAEADARDLLAEVDRLRAELARLNDEVVRALSNLGSAGSGE